MIHWDPQTGETFKGPSAEGPWTPISREEFDVRFEHQDCPLPLEWTPGFAAKLKELTGGDLA